MGNERRAGRYQATSSIFFETLIFLSNELVIKMRIFVKRAAKKIDGLSTVHLRTVHHAALPPY